MVDMCVMVSLMPHCRLSSVGENYIQIWMVGSLTNAPSQFPAGLLAFSQIDAQVAPKHMHSYTSLTCVHMHTHTGAYAQRGSSESLFAVSPHCLASVDFNARLTLSPGYTKLPVVRGVLKISLPK